MALFSLISRISDGMPFMESTDAVSEQLKQQAKTIAKRVDPLNGSRLRVDCGAHQITYLLEDGLSFLVVTDTAYPKALTLSYLVRLHKEFTQYLRDHDGDGWRMQVDTCAKVYGYQGFTSAKLQQLKKEYADPSSKSNSARLTEELQDVHSIIKKNVQEVLQRGENLDRAFPRSLTQRQRASRLPFVTSPLTRPRPRPPLTLPQTCQRFPASLHQTQRLSSGALKS